MHVNVAKEVATQKAMSVGELRAKYAQVFGEETRAGNKSWLIRRIIWRLQTLAEADLSERARRRAAELAQDADLRLFAPRVCQGRAGVGQWPWEGQPPGTHGRPPAPAGHHPHPLVQRQDAQSIG